MACGLPAGVQALPLPVLLAVEALAVKLICTIPVRNEAWCLGLTLRAVLMWCDEVIVLLHCCTDATEAISCCWVTENLICPPWQTEVWAPFEARAIT